MATRTTQPYRAKTPREIGLALWNMLQGGPSYMANPIQASRTAKKNAGAAPVAPATMPSNTGAVGPSAPAAPRRRRGRSYTGKTLPFNPWAGIPPSFWKGGQQGGQGRSKSSRTFSRR